MAAGKGLLNVEELLVGAEAELRELIINPNGHPYAVGQLTKSLRLLAAAARTLHLRLGVLERGDGQMLAYYCAACKMYYREAEAPRRRCPECGGAVKPRLILGGQVMGKEEQA